MPAVVYRPSRLGGSWRPCSLVDKRGPRFPEEYQEIRNVIVEYVSLVDQFEKINTETLSGLFEEYAPTTGDVVFLGKGEDLMAYVCGPMGWEIVKFGAEWRSPD